MKEKKHLKKINLIQKLKDNLNKNKKAEQNDPFNFSIKRDILRDIISLKNIDNLDYTDIYDTYSRQIKLHDEQKRKKSLKYFAIILPIFIGILIVGLIKLEKEIKLEIEQERLAKIEKERLAEIEKERLAKIEKERLAKIEKERLAKINRELFAETQIQLSKIEKERLAKIEKERLAKIAQDRHLKKIQMERLEFKKIILLNKVNSKTEETLRAIRFVNIEPLAVGNLKGLKLINYLEECISDITDLEVKFICNYKINKDLSGSILSSQFGSHEVSILEATRFIANYFNLNLQVREKTIFFLIKK